jgi:TolB-like protein
MPSVYRFDRFEVRPAERKLLAHGQSVPLGARAFDVLISLLRHPEELVTKQDLLDQVWPGLVIAENNLSVQISALRKVLGPASIATVAGLGYRFAVPVAEAVRPAGLVDAQASSQRPGIAVLPFRVLSPEPAHGLLADGLVADVIALLARVPGFVLISRASSFAFRDQETAPAEVARKLSVRYLVEGNLRVIGANVHVSTQLTDAATGHVLWSRDFDSPRASVDDLQEGIARGIIAQLQPELIRAEIALIKRQRPENLDAWAYFHQGIDEIASRGWGEESLVDARGHFRRAMTADPEFGLGHAFYALYTAVGMRIGLVADSPTLAADVSAAVEKAIALDGRSSEVLGAAGCALRNIGSAERGIELLREAVAIDPSNANARVALGAGLTFQGQPDEGIALMRWGMRISPRDRGLGFWAWVLANCLLYQDRSEEALVEARVAASRDVRLHLARIAEAAALARLGYGAAAIEPLRRARDLRPKLSLQEIVLTHGRRVGAELTPCWLAIG